MANYSLLYNSLALLQYFCGVPILIYHSIGGKDNDALPASVFKEQLDFFKREKIKVLSLQEFVDALSKGSGFNYPSVCLTFDDGYADFYDTAYPLLKDYNFPAALFMTVEKIDSSGYLNIGQLKEIAREGLVCVASHTMSHRNLSLLDSFGLDYEMSVSRSKLGLLLGINVNFLAYPWGIFQKHICEAAREYGYMAAFSTNMKLRGCATKPGMQHSIRRITIGPFDSKIRFLVKVSGIGLLAPKEIDCGDCHD